MKAKIPFLNTAPEMDMAVLFTLTPLWWVLGFSFFVYHLAVLFLAVRLMLFSARSGESFRMPKRLYPFVFFLICYLVSITVNAWLRPAERIFASLNNYGMLVMGILMMLAVYNSRAEVLLTLGMKSCRILCAVTGFLGVLSLFLWRLGYANLSVDPLTMRIFPRLADYPYFNSLMIMKLTVTEWLFGEMPRLSLYSGAPTATGGLMLMIMPLMMVYYSLERHRLFEQGVVFGLAFFALLFAQSRSALCGGLAAWVFVEVLGRKRKLLIGLIALFLALAFFNQIYQGLEWVLNLRQSSNVGREMLYREAFDIVRDENIFLGLGVRLREDFTMTSVGSHACYMELLFVSGLIGLVSFIVFQCSIALEWLSQEKRLKNEVERQLWKGLGLAFWGTNLWLVTDTILAYPHIAFAYFLMTGFILLFGKSLRQGRVFDWQQGELIFLSGTGGGGGG